ncbi:14405_t:CDS:2 [Rhizophagus irregularis]|nr:14405_t:CDS:2 [Rhizophagus irregularis]
MRSFYRKINNFLDEKELTATIWQRIKSQDLLVGSYLDDDEETHRNERQEDIKHWIEFHGIDQTSLLNMKLLQSTKKILNY